MFKLTTLGSLKKATGLLWCHKYVVVLLEKFATVNLVCPSDYVVCTQEKPLNMNASEVNRALDIRSCNFRNYDSIYPGTKG